VAIGGNTHTAVARFLGRTPARLVALQIEDVLEIEDQPNLPGTTREYPNWRRRLPLPPEALGDALARSGVPEIMHQTGRKD
jgi:4-alpha-glucanotransferase